MLLPFDDPPAERDAVAQSPKAEARPGLGFGGAEPGGVSLLLGPPRGGKTGRLLARYLDVHARELAAGRVGACVWLTPNRLSREAVTADLAAAAGGPLLGHGVLTFENLTDALLAGLPGPPLRRLGAASRRRVLRAVVEAVLARGDLPHFAGITRTGGFLGLLDRQIRSWKYEEVRPGEVEAAGSPARRELAALYAAYQDRLRRPADGGPPLFDAEGRLWAARTRLAEADGDRGPRYALVVVDGFTSFTRTQRDLLAALAGRSANTVVALPFECSSDDGPAREPLYSRVAETARLLRERFAADSVELADIDHPPDRPPDALGRLAAALFDERHAPPPCPADLGAALAAGQVALVEAGTAAAEVRACLAAVKTRLLAGVRADRVAVVARSPRDYADEFFRLADAAGIPIDADRPVPLARRPAVRAVLAPWRLEVGRWEYAPLVRLLRSDFFRFDLPDPRKEETPAAGTASRAAARCLRFANVGDGRRAVVKVAADLNPDREDGDRFADDGLAPAAVDRARFFAAVSRLDAALEPAREAATFAGWCGRLRGLAEVLDFAPPADGPREPWEDDAADLAAAREALDDAAAEVAAESGDDPPPELTLSEFLSAADELLAAVSVPGPPAVPGGVRLIDAETARTAGCDHLFLLGLGEGQFPAPPPRGDAADADAADPDAHARAEMLLFFGVVTRPAKSLTLSYPTLDEQARRLFPGPFVQAVRDAFAPLDLPATIADGLDPAPTLAAAQTADDARVAAARALLDDGDAAPLATLHDSPAEGPAVRSTLGAVRMLAARTRSAGPTAFDGGLSAGGRRLWAKRRPSNHEFSATELEEFAQNPHRYFLNRALGACRPDPPRLFHDHAARGGAMHEALKRAHEAAEPGEDAAAIAERVRAFLADLRPRNATFARWHDGLWETEREVLTHIADDLAEQIKKDDAASARRGARSPGRRTWRSRSAAPRRRRTTRPPPNASRPPGSGRTRISPP